MTALQSAPAATVDIHASPPHDASRQAVLHIVRERDVGLFNLVLGVIPHTYWALTEDRIPIIYYGNKNCYWTPNGYHGCDTVWEYYFEPVIPGYPVSQIPAHVRKLLDDPALNKRPGVGYFVDEFAFVSHNAAWHIEVDGEGLRGPKTYKAPSCKVRELASMIVRNYIRPRDYIIEKANAFFNQYMERRYVIGVHIRGTDALVDTTRHVRQGRINFPQYIAVLRRLRREHPDALIFVASDEQPSVDRIRNAFDRVIAYDSIRHEAGEMVGRGPAGGILPAYLTGNPEVAARNGEQAVIEYLLLCRSNYLVHNFSSMPRMVLLTVPDMPETNTDIPSLVRQISPVFRRHLEVVQRRVKLVRDTISGKPIGSWHYLLHELWRAKLANRQKHLLRESSKTGVDC